MALFVILQGIFATVLISSFILRSRSCTLSPRAFGIEPSDKLAYRGNFVNFTCVVHKFDPLFDTIQWKSQPDMNNTNVIEKYYEKSRDVVSIITVQARISEQYFTCERVYSKYNMCFSSRRATLKVQFSRHFPDKNNLECGPNNPEPLQEGDILRTFCRVPRGNPPVDLNWRLQPNIPTVFLPPHRDDAFHRVLTRDLPITQEFHNRVIVCEVTSEIAFPGRLLQCLIGPIVVTHSPTVLVHPMNADVSHGLIAEFTCVANGYPDQFSFSWSCLPDGVFTGCESMSKTANISLRRNLDSADLNGVHTRVECTVSNGIDQAMGFAHVELLPSNTKHQRKTNLQNSSCPKDILVNVTFHDANDSKPDNKERVISCSVPNISQQEIHFNWYVGDHNIQRDNPNVVIQEISLVVSYLHVLNFTLGDFSKSIICEVNISPCNLTYKGFINIRDSFEEQLKRNKDISTSYNQLNITHPRSLMFQVELSTPNPALSTNSSQLDIHHTSLPFREYTSTLLISLQSKQDMMTNDGRKIITFALLGSSGIVIVVSCIVAVISVTMYKHLKRENMKSMNSFREELKTGYRVSMSDLKSETDHIYDVAQVESTKLSKLTFISHATDIIPVSTKKVYISDSSDNCSSYTGSADSSWSDSSGVYLDPNPDIHSPKQNFDLISDMDVQNVYGNGNVVQMYVTKGNRSRRSPTDVRSTTKRQQTLEGSDILMPPPFPLKTPKNFEYV